MIILGLPPLAYLVVAALARAFQMHCVKICVDNITARSCVPLPIIILFCYCVGYDLVYVEGVARAVGRSLKTTATTIRLSLQQ